MPPSGDFPKFSLLNVDPAELGPSCDNPMGANESARQAGSNDTMPDSELENLCFTVRRLVPVLY